MPVFDIETDGLRPTKIHCLSYMDEAGICHTLSDYGDIRKFALGADTLIGHNIICYDIPVLERLLSIQITAKVIDTLPLSWYLNFNNARHGLATYGEFYGVPKPEVDDWEGLSLGEYKVRCEEDVKINTLLWKDLEHKLGRLYYKDDDNAKRLIEYLNFKMSCLRDQENYGWRLDVEKATALSETLTALKSEKEIALSKAMPKKPITKVRTMPRVMYKKDGSLSALGQSWLETLDNLGLPPTVTQPVTIIDGYEDGNPNSVPQVKDWLYSLGWAPRTFKYKGRNDDGTEDRIEQVRDGTDLCDSVKDLADKDPAVSILDGLTVISHRLAIVNGFLSNNKDGYLVAGASGLTNTLRFKHRNPLVNIPGVDKDYGEDIRACLTAPDGYVLCGSDMVSLEDTTKRHYMQPKDPDYVAEMSKEGFDPHLDLAVFAGACSREDAVKHGAGTMDLSSLRKKYKAANYSCVYGVGAVSLARSTGLSPKQATGLIKAYWERNWAIKEVAEEQSTKKMGDETWVKNPVSKFWHNLRNEKDTWSTINQSTGVFCFDTWLAYVKAAGVKVIGQFHDEVICLVKFGEGQITYDILKRAMMLANRKLNLNVELDIDVQFGSNYAEIH